MLVSGKSNVCSWARLERRDGPWQPNPNEGSQCEVLIQGLSDKSSLCDHGSVKYAEDGVHTVTIGDATNWFDDAVEACLERMREGDMFQLNVPLSTLHTKYLLSKSPADCATEMTEDVKSDSASENIVESNARFGANEAISGNESGLAVASCATHYTMHVTLKSFKRQTDIWELSAEEKLSRAVHYKTIGLKLYSHDQLEWSFRNFSKALKYLILIGQPCDVPSHLQTPYVMLKSQCYFNLAACQLKKSNFTSVLANCNKGLALTSDNVKGLYRRAQAYVGLHDYDGAVNDLKMALQLEPGNVLVSRLLTTVKQQLVSENKNMAKAMSKLFST